MHIGRRIRLARLKAKMSMRDLARAAGVSAMAISKFERGETSPRQSTILRLAEALSVSMEYFFRDTGIEKLQPAYRKHSNIGKREQDSIEAGIVESVERHLIVEGLFPYNPSPAESLPRIPVQSIDDAEKAAETVRSMWNAGNGPIDSVCNLLEDQGVKVVCIPGPPGFDGFSCWVNGSIPAVAYNQNMPGDRQRFSLAHELGHLVLSLVPSVDGEAAANRFAAAFLVPACSARRELGCRRSNLNLNELRVLKQKYGLSIQAWVKRAFDLTIIDRDAYSALFKIISSRGWRKKEPNGVPPEIPRRFELLVHRAESEGLITAAYSATLLGTGRDVLRTRHKMLPVPGDGLINEYRRNPEIADFLEAALEDGHEYHP